MSIHQKDWMMRQIEELVEFSSRIFWRRGFLEYTVSEDNQTANDLLYIKINKLIDDNNICEAEDVLFSAYGGGDNLDFDYLSVVLSFYNRLNGMTDKFLEENDFSREEVYDGLNDMLKNFGLPDMKK